MQLIVEDAIDECLREATSNTVDVRRQQHRFPFFRPITVVDTDGQTACTSAFCRDISPAGLGLLHRVPLRGEVDVVVPLSSGSLNTSVKIRWCQECCEGWYVSGGEFTRLMPFEASRLIWSTVLTESQRRLKQRFAYFRPLTLTLEDGSSIAAFSRDISSDGIGLLHPISVQPQHAILHLATNQGPAEIRVEIRWCQPCGEDWFVSGARLIRVDFEELPQRW